MSRSFVRSSFRLTALATLVLALSLGACGRKGPLDPPPGASTAVPVPGPAPEDVLKFGPAPASPTPGARND